MAPPKNAIVLCVDEKPSIQALERAQGYLKLPNGRALTGHSHDYKRRGTTTLFAAFEVATGKVRAAHKKRRRRKEFLDFMDEIVADYPKARLKVILDNLNTHKKNDEWLKRHPLVTFHFTPRVGRGPAHGLTAAAFMGKSPKPRSKPIFVLGASRHIASPHDFGRRRGIAEVVRQRPAGAEANAYDPKQNFECYRVLYVG